MMVRWGIYPHEACLQLVVAVHHHLDFPSSPEFARLYFTIVGVPLTK